MGARDPATHLEASSVLRELARQRDEVVESSADAFAFLRKHGFDVVAREIGKLIELQGSDTTVITGLRTIEEIEALQEMSGAPFSVIGVGPARDQTLLLRPLTAS